MAEEDLIFGKKRHLFGGIEPSNMVDFKVLAENGNVKIYATLPNDTIVNGQTLCTVAGAKILRKTSGYPRNEFDGELVIDLKESTTFSDSGAVATNTYYYAAFPYTTQGVYNRNKKNRVTLNELPPLKVFSAEHQYTKQTDTALLKIKVALPSWATGVIVRKSTLKYPENETDGEEVANLTSDGVYIDRNVKPDKNYYFAAFPYNSTTKQYDNEQNRFIYETRRCNYFYGYDINENDPNHKTRITYPSDVDNAAYKSAKMVNEDGSTQRFDYGDWPNKPGVKFMPKPCTVDFSGKVINYLDIRDFSKTESGSPSGVEYNNDDAKINLMMEWPKIYIKRWVENGVYKFRCSDIQQDDTWDCWCNYDKNNNQIDHFYTSIYHAYIDRRGYARSYPDSYERKTLKKIVDGAVKTGSDWTAEVVADRMLIIDLLNMISKNTNHVEVYGYPSSSLYTELEGTYMGCDNGLFSRTNDGLVIIFGMIGYITNNAYRQVLGLAYDHTNSSYKIKITRGTHDGSSATDYNFTGSGYITNMGASLKTGTEGYVSKMISNKFGRFPSILNGSSTTYDCLLVDTKLYNSSYKISHAVYSNSSGYGSIYLDRHQGFSATASNNSTMYEVYTSGLSLKPTKTTV